MHASWKRVLQDEFRSPSFQDLIKFVERERSTYTVFPPVGEVFTAFDLTPFEDVKVVILGQDPYHGVGQAHGLSFSVKPGVLLPPSLVNIFTEARSDGVLTGTPGGCLKPWAEQGVFLLNSVLTVRSGVAGSHQYRGWEAFTNAVIRKLSEREKPMVFILWGSYARDKKPLIDLDRHTVIESAHPSPMSADRGFFESRPFSRANAALVAAGQTPIDWQLPLV